MIFVTGPMYAGKREYIRTALSLSEEDFARRAVWDVQEQASGDLEALADALSRFEIVIATEIGAGVIPLDREERVRRENAGRLACLLAERAECVVRVCCGLPQLLKGNLKC